MNVEYLGNPTLKDFLKRMRGQAYIGSCNMASPSCLSGGIGRSPCLYNCIMIKQYSVKKITY